MSTDTLTFQTAFALLLTDPREIDRFYDDPTGFAVANDLSETQVAALRSIDRKRLTWASESLGIKRFFRVETYFPATFALLRQNAALERVEQALVTTYRPIKSEQWSRSFRDSFWVAEIVERMVAGGELGIPFLLDVLRCEHAEFLLWAEAATGESANEFLALNTGRPAVSVEEVLDAGVRVGRHVVVREFTCDVLPLVQALAQGQAPPPPSPTPTVILFGRLPGGERVQKARVGRLMQTFLARADGVRTPREILAEMVDPSLGPGERQATEQGCARMLLQLLALHFVTLRDGVSPRSEA